MKRVCVIGHFGFGHDLLNGQTIKTKIVADEIEQNVGKDEIVRIDTHGGFIALIKLPFILLYSVAFFRNIVFLPAHKGLRIIAPLLVVLNSFFRRELHYVVVGGWMPSLVERKPFLRYCLKKITYIYVETTVMKKDLEKLYFSNIIILLNCKPLKILSENELTKEIARPLKFCIFSRVMKQKGIEDAIYVITKINEMFGPESCCLDIYGQIDQQEVSWFENLQRNFAKNINYKGIVPFDKSVDVLKNYSALLFPTLFYTEGIPGTIIDAYAAGLPVVSSQWASFNDIIDIDVGYSYEFSSRDAFFDIIKELVANPKGLINKKKQCIERAAKFLPCNAMKFLLENMR